MPKRPKTPPKRTKAVTDEDVWVHQQRTTPVKCRIQGVYNFAEKHGILGYKNDLFRQNGVSKSTGYRILKSNSRTLRNDRTPGITDPRGRQSKISAEQIQKMEHLLETEGWDARTMSWAQLGLAAGVEACDNTIRKAMGSRDYRKCIACQKSWVSNKHAARRVEWARLMLERYPTPDHWLRVRFSDEVHFGWGPQQKIHVIRKPGERQCPDCIQEKQEPAEKDKKRFHCWAAVGYNFKSDIHFYDIPGNKNGKMTQEVYVKDILQRVVLPWILSGHDFVLEEDGDSGHGPAHNRNLVSEWKKTHNLEHYFNCAGSPDLSPIENCWLQPKQYVRTVPHWDDATLEKLIIEGWNTVSQESINKKILEMPKRLQAVIDSGGKMTGY